MKENYYDIEKISESTHKIYENFEASMYLVCGSKRACLIDTGYGGGDIWGVIRSITDLPVFVINTHGHIDHVMGNRLFDTAYLNSADNAIYEAVIHDFPEIMKEPWVLEQYGEEIAGMDLSAVHFPEAKEIKDGDVFDLGGIELEVLQVPGHTPGSLVLIDRKEKIVFTGDAIIEHCWMFLEHSLPKETYLDALRNAKEKLVGIEKIYNGHYAYHPMDIGIIDVIIKGIEDIIAGREVETKPFVNDVGKGTEYFFDGCSVLFRE